MSTIALANMIVPFFFQVTNLPFKVIDSFKSFTDRTVVGFVTNFVVFIGTEIHNSWRIPLFEELSNPFYAIHALWETSRTGEDGHPMFLTDTTGSVLLFAGLFTVTTVKVVVLRLTANMFEELIGVPLLHGIIIPLFEDLSSRLDNHSGTEPSSC